MARWWMRLAAAWIIWPLAGALAPLPSHAEESIIAGHIVNVAGRVRIRKDGSKDTKDIRFARAGDVVMVGDIINTPSDGMIKLLLKDRSLMDLGPSSLFKVNAFKAAANNERQVDSTIVYGSLRAAVTQKIEGRGHFKVRSPSATMGVRGTEFLVRSSMPDDLKSMGSFLNGGALNTSNTSGPAALDAMIKLVVTVFQGEVGVALAQAPQTPQNPSTTGAGVPSAISSTPSDTLTLRAGAQVTAQAGGQAPQAPATRVLDSSALTQVASGARVADNTFTASLEIIAATKQGERAQAREEPREQVAQEVASRNETGSDRGPAAQGSGSAGGNLGMTSFVDAAMAGVQMGGAMAQTIRPADFVPAVPLSATGIQAQAIPNPNQLHNLVIQIRIQP